MNLMDGLNALQECVKPVVVSLPDSEQQILVSRRLLDDGTVETMVDVRPFVSARWVPIELEGGRFEVRDD